MNSLGFIREHDKNHTDSVPFSALSKDSHGASHVTTELLEYLNNGTILVATLIWLSDIETGRPIGPHIIRTDGEWIWPDYLAHYLKQGYTVTMPNNFVTHVEKNKYVIPQLNESGMKKIMKYYLMVTGQQLPRGMF